MSILNRRQFLKLGCLGGAATGLAVCGLTAARPDTSLPELSTYTFGDQKMHKRILIAYASEYGSTEEIAVKLGENIAADGLAVDVRPIRTVTIQQISPDDYQAVLLGSAVHYGNWLPQALEFIKVHKQSLDRLPVAVFSVHIRNIGEDDESRRQRLAYLDEVRQMIRPVNETFFAGRFDRRAAREMLPAWAARFVPTIDLRKWSRIYTYAEQIRPQLVG